MKSLIILLLLAFTGTTVDAQTSKKKARKNTRTETRTKKEHPDTLAMRRQRSIDSTLAYQLQYDSVRRDNERVSDEKFFAEQNAWRESKLRTLDRNNFEQWKTLSKNREQWNQIETQRRNVNSAAKLSDYQNRQVLYINQASFEKAKLIQGDSVLTPEEKNNQYMAINNERRSKIRSVIGKSKERKVEKARRENINPADTEAQWLTELDKYAKN